MGKPKKDIVWKHYRVCEDKSVICSFCDKKYKFANVNKMEKHLKKCFQCPEQYKNTLKEVSAAEMTSTPINLSQTCKENISPNSTTASSSSRASTIEEPLPADHIHDLHGALAKAIYVSGSPLSMVEHPLWVNFFKQLVPLYKLPSRKAISTTYLEKTYREMHTELMNELRVQTYLHLQCDGWSDVRNEGIINFLISKPEPVFVKSVDTADNRHTGEYISREILKVMENYGENKFVVLIGDNASNVQRAFRLVKNVHPHITYLNCAAHTLNRLCEDILETEALKAFIDLAVDCIKVVKRSQIISAMLTDLVREKGVGETLKLPCKTRWGSYFISLKSLENTKLALQTLAVHERSTLPDETKATFLNEDFWKMAQQSKSLLKPIAETIFKLESDKYNMHSVYINLRDMKSELEFALPDVDFLQEVDKENIIRLADNRISMCIKPIHLAAYLLDPTSQGVELKENEQLDATEFIYNMANNLGMDIMPNLAHYRAKEGLWARRFIWSSVGNTAPIVWWKGLCSSTNLSKIAVRILTAPCTSAATERSFSCQSNIHSKKRNRLTSSRAGKIAYIAYNWNISNRQASTNNDDDESPVISPRSSSPLLSASVNTNPEVEFFDCSNISVDSSSDSNEDD